MIPTERDIIELVDMIWSTTLGLDVRPFDPTSGTTWTLPAVEAQVHIAGSWQGAVVLHTSEALASIVAHRMLDLGRRSATPEDVQDAFGEIANQTGGNIKGLLSDGDAHLSLPAVVQGLDYQVRIPGSQQVLRLEFICEGEPLVVTLLQAGAARPAAGHARAGAGADAH